MLEEKAQYYYNQIKKFERMSQHLEEFYEMMQGNKYLEPPTKDSVYKLFLKAKKELPEKIKNNEVYGYTERMIPEILELIDSMGDRSMKKEIYEKFYGKSPDEFIEYLEEKFDLPF